MPATNAENHLREKVLDILYSKNINKSVWISVEEVFWTVDDFSVNEDQIKKALDWLVEQGMAIPRSGKYQISQEEFLKRSKRTSRQKSGTSSEQQWKKTIEVNKEKRIASPAVAPKNSFSFWVSVACFVACCTMIVLIAIGTDQQPAPQEELSTLLTRASSWQDTLQLQFDNLDKRLELLEKSVHAYRINSQRTVLYSLLALIFLGAGIFFSKKT